MNDQSILALVRELKTIFGWEDTQQVSLDWVVMRDVDPCVHNVHKILPKITMVKK